MSKKLNLTFLKYTNQGHYFGEYEMPEASCFLSNPMIDYIALYGEKADSKYHFPALCFYEYDDKFDGIHGIFDAIYYDNKNLLNKYRSRLKDFTYVISPDYSICGDIPFIENAYRIFKSRIVGSYLVTKLNKIVIPNISFVDEKTKEVALSGIAKHSTVALSTKGLLRRGHKLLEYIVDETLKVIEPSVIILYNVAVNSPRLKCIIESIENADVKAIMPPNKLLIRNQILERK